MAVGRRHVQRAVPSDREPTGCVVDPLRHFVPMNSGKRGC
jgi:hypothetical protein